MNGLAPKTSLLFNAITELECIKPFVLVGGTALSLQIGNRQSEDLDFMRWKQGAKDKLEMETMLRRAKYRDYYDLYSILKSGIDINEMITMALDHSSHRLKRKNLLAMISNGDFFTKDSSFIQLAPIYDVTAYDIQEYIIQKLTE